MAVPLTIRSPSARGPVDPERPSVLSYFALRRAAGYIGLFLPPVVAVYDIVSIRCFPASISASYYTGARNYFVGSLCAVGVFLICSIGYREDRPWSVLAGILAVVVAFSPTDPDTCRGVGAASPPAMAPWIHRGAAVALFATFAYFCLRLFVRTRVNGVVVRRPRAAMLAKPKRKRNATFVVCGWTMVGAMAVGGGWYGLNWLAHVPVPSHLMFAIEWICLWAFALAWLVKGQQLFKDAEALAEGDPDD